LQSYAWWWWVARAAGCREREKRKAARERRRGVREFCALIKLYGFGSINN